MHVVNNLNQSIELKTRIHYQVIKLFFCYNWFIDLDEVDEDDRKERLAVVIRIDLNYNIAS